LTVYDETVYVVAAALICMGVIGLIWYYVKRWIASLDGERLE